MSLYLAALDVEHRIRCIALRKHGLFTPVLPASFASNELWEKSAWLEDDGAFGSNKNLPDSANARGTVEPVYRAAAAAWRSPSPAAN